MSRPRNSAAHPPRPTRAGVTAAVLAALGSIAACAWTNPEPRGTAPGPPSATTAVIRQDLTIRDEFPGSLGFGEAVPLVVSRDGVVTWMPAEGTVVRPGEVVAEIDGVATRLLIGARPAWRRLAVGEPDGPDVRQLSDSLAALGFPEPEAMPDDRFDWRTRDAVYRWQESLGFPRTGVVELGDVMFVPGEVRMGTVEAPPGTWVGAGAMLAQVTSTKQVVTVALDPAHRSSLAEGLPVIVMLPDRTQVEAIVRSIGRVVSAPADPASEPSVRVEIDLAAADATSSTLDRTPVLVIADRVLVEDALVVPVAALLALAGRGYAVERVTASGTELIDVMPGQFADGLVEITGDLAAGDEIVVPS